MTDTQLSAYYGKVQETITKTDPTKLKTLKQIDSFLYLNIIDANIAYLMWKRKSIFNEQWQYVANIIRIRTRMQNIIDNVRSLTADDRTKITPVLFPFVHALNTCHRTNVTCAQVGMQVPKHVI